MAHIYIIFIYLRSHSQNSLTYVKHLQNSNHRNYLTWSCPIWSGLTMKPYLCYFIVLTSLKLANCILLITCSPALNTVNLFQILTFNVLEYDILIRLTVTIFFIVSLNAVFISTLFLFLLFIVFKFQNQEFSKF